MPGGSPGFDPFMHQSFPAAQPYYAAPPQHPRSTPRPVVYQQPQPRPRAVRPATPIATTTREPGALATLKPVELPSPEKLGIRLDEPPVVLPEPEKLGIRLN